MSPWYRIYFSSLSRFGGNIMSASPQNLPRPFFKMSLLKNQGSVGGRIRNGSNVEINVTTGAWCIFYCTLNYNTALNTLLLEGKEISSQIQVFAGPIAHIFRFTMFGSTFEHFLRHPPSKALLDDEIKDIFVAWILIFKINIFEGVWQKGKMNIFLKFPLFSLAN